MARIASADPENATGEESDILRDIIDTRGAPVENIFLALAPTPSLCKGVLAMATSLRRSQLLPRRFRELAVVTVGIAADSRYEVEHHWRVALKEGITPEELEAIPDFATSALFTEEERAIIGFALELTQTGRTSDAQWAKLGFLDEACRVELTLTVAWYNAVCRIIGALDLEVEEWLSPVTVPDLRFAADHARTDA